MIRTLSIGVGIRVRSQANIPVLVVLKSVFAADRSNAGGIRTRNHKGLNFAAVPIRVPRQME